MGVIYDHRQSGGQHKLIFCVEDDEAAGNLAAYALESAGFHVQIFPNGQAFFKALESAEPELILLDIMLPGEDGLSILKKLRADSSTSEIPVILTTAKGTEFDKVKGLDLGADDYLVKPFRMLEMVSRVKAVLRRVSAHKPENDLLAIGPIVMNDTAHQVTVDGRHLELTLKEYSLLELFMRNPDRVFDRDTLLLKIWNNEYSGDTRTVDVHVGTLRSKLGKASNMIQTVRGVGYKLVSA